MSQIIEKFKKVEEVNEVESLFQQLCLTEKEKSFQDETQETLLVQTKTDLNSLLSDRNFSLKLKRLNISFAELSEIPSEILNFKYLTELDLSNNQLERLPNEIGNLCNLIKLLLSKNRLSCLPKSLRYLHQINYLDLSHNKFVEVPVVVHFGLRSLKILDLSHNEIRFFNEPPACISKLIVLNISKNALKQVPGWVFSNTCSLQVLDVSKNQMSFSAAGMNSYNSELFTSLWLLNMSNCNYWSGKVEFLSAFKNLKVVYLGNEEETFGRNHFGNLTPETLDSLKHVKCLYLQNVRLATLPPSFDRLRNVRVLDLSNNLLSWLPDSFCDLTSLRILYLSSNKILYLPKSICKLVNLKRVHLSCNSIFEIPEEFYLLDNLEFVDLYDNKIEKVDEELFKLKNLKGIDLGLNFLGPSSLADGYENLKNNFRKVFDVSRSDFQNQILVASPVEETWSSGCSVNSNSDLEDSSVGVKTPREDSEAENWEKSNSEAEEDEFFDPTENSIRRPIKNSWNLDFQKNYCPAYTHVPSVLKSYFRNRNSSRLEPPDEGQFDSE